MQTDYIAYLSIICGANCTSASGKYSGSCVSAGGQSPSSNLQGREGGGRGSQGGGGRGSQGGRWEGQPGRAGGGAAREEGEEQPGMRGEGQPGRRGRSSQGGGGRGSQGGGGIARETQREGLTQKESTKY